MYLIILFLSLRVRMAIEEEEEQRGVVVAEVEEQSNEEASKKESMAEIDEKPQVQTNPQTEINKKFEKMSISLSIWPPTQRTRDAVINRLIETLSTPSILSKRYGSMSPDEAASTARLIEEEAFSAASSSSSSSSSDENTKNNATEDDGIEILQVYSKEISKRMLEAVKSKASNGSSPSENASQSHDSTTGAVASEDISSVESES